MRLSCLSAFNWSIWLPHIFALSLFCICWRGSRREPKQPREMLPPVISVLTQLWLLGVLSAPSNGLDLLPDTPSLFPQKVYPRPLWVYSRGLQRAWGLFKQAAISNAKITATPEECSKPDLLSFSLSLIQVCVSFFFVVSLSSFSNWCYWEKKKIK